MASPFYLRTGKALATSFTEINIVFKRPPSVLFSAATDEQLRRNTLRIRIQPAEGISLKFNAKVPGEAASEPVDMAFSYKSGFDHYLPEAYERLIVDAIVGESTLFTARRRGGRSVAHHRFRQGRVEEAEVARPAALRLRIDGPGRVRPAPAEGRTLLDSPQRARFVMMRYAVLGLVLVGGLGLLRAQDAPEPPDDNDTSPLHVALVAYKAGKYDEARTAIDAAEKANPRDLPTELLKAKILTEQHDFAGGEKLLRGLLTPAGPIEVQLGLGDLLLRKHSFDRAAKYYTAALTTKPGDPDITLKLIYCKIGGGDLVGAGQLASNLKPLDPKNPYDPHASYYFAKAALAQATNNTQGAEDNIQNARTIYGNTITDRYLKTYLEVFAKSDQANSDLTPAPLVKPAPSGAK